MSHCNKCGEEIVFRTYEGHPIPIHVAGSCGHRSPYPEERLRKAIRISCRVCKQGCFLVEHNGGRVVLDSLGHPWPKHSCQIATPLIPGRRGVVAVSRRDAQAVIREQESVRPKKRAPRECPRCHAILVKKSLRSHLRRCPMRHIADPHATKGSQPVHG